MGKQMPIRVQLVYKDAVDNLMFLKRQQWLVTTYALTAYAALFAVARAISVSGLGKLWFIIAIGLVAYFAWRVLGEFKKGIKRIIDAKAKTRGSIDFKTND